MENDILDSLEDTGYSGPLLEDALFEKALEAGPKSPEFTHFVHWITEELAGYTGLEDSVNAISDPDDSETFLMELSGFLREYGCPYSQLCEGPITQRLETRENKLHLMNYLLTELQALRMTAAHQPHLLQKAAPKQAETTPENETAEYLKNMLIALKFPKPPEDITVFQLFSKVEMKVKGLLAKVQAAHTSKPILKAKLTPRQWESVENINSALREEYTCRRDMMLKRLDCTIQSFRWSDRVKGKDNDFAAKYQTIRRILSSKAATDIPHLLAAREDLLNVEKTSGESARAKTKCQINKHIIGKVPDRGGRAYEMQPPPPEMPSFQKRQSQPQGQRQNYDGGRGGGRGGDRGRRGGGRGGDRIQGGWGDSRGQSAGGGWSQNQPQYSQQPGHNANQGNALFGVGGAGGGYQQHGQQKSFGYQGYEKAGGAHQGGGGTYQQYGNTDNYQQGGGYQQPYQQGYQGSGGGYQGGGGGYQGGGGGGGHHRGGGGHHRGGGHRGGRGGR